MLELSGSISTVVVVSLRLWHFVFKRVAYVGFREGSWSPFPVKLKSLLLNKLQWPTPIVCAPIHIANRFISHSYYVHLTQLCTENVPDNTTRSCTVSFLLSKLCLSWVMLKKGAGRLAKASPLMDTLPSLLPVSTSHIGLLNCKYYQSATCITQDCIWKFCSMYNV